MPRTKKLDSAAMVQIVDTYFTSDGCGDPQKLKCSLLEQFAVRNGFALKAYDFRRDKAVRERICVLKDLVKNQNGIQMLSGSSYRNLDVEKLLHHWPDPEKLRNALTEMDAYWHEVYDVFVKTAGQNKELLESNRRVRAESDRLQSQVEALQSQIEMLMKAKRELQVENRYLRKMLRTYLYPAVADQILCEEGAALPDEVKIPPIAAKKLVDGRVPAAFSEAIATDHDMKSREDFLLEQMWKKTEDMDG